MKQRSLLILSAAVLLLASCGNNGGKTGLMVPKDAAIVIHINSKSLGSKLSWNEIRQTNWFQHLKADAPSDDSLAQRLLDDPSNSGIDTQEDFVMYIRKQGRGSYMVFQGSLTSQAKYEQLLADMNKKQPQEIKKAGDFSYINPGDDAVVLWNKSKFAFITNVDMGNNNFAGGLMKGRGMDGGDSYKFGADSLRIFGQQALTLEGGQNLDTDSRFADLVKDGSDVHAWVNAGQYYTGMSALKRMAPMVNTDALFKDNISAVSLNFDNGKITAKTKRFYNDEMSKIASANRPKAVTADVINRIPSNDVVAVMAFNFSPSGLKEVLRVVGVDTFADTYLAQMNFSIDELVKAMNGEMVLAVCEPSFGMDSTDMGGKTDIRPKKPGAKILFATSVKDKASFDKMVAILGGLAQRMSGKDDEGTGAPTIPGISYKASNDWFAVSNAPEYTDKFLAGGNSNLPFVNKITGHPMGLYVDLQRIMKLTGSMSREGSPGRAVYEASLNMWQDVTATGGDLNGKVSEGYFEINLVDKNTNSLKQLNQYIDRIATSMNDIKKERAARLNEMMMDSVAPKGTN